MKKKLVFTVLFLVCIKLFPQTDKEKETDNLIKYWNYKDRFKKFFTQIGTKQGQSIPIINKQVNDGPKVEINGKAVPLYGTVSFGDAMVDQGWYLAALATEYKVLLDQHQDLTAIRNEIYYALEAVNRVDALAEPYFNSSFPPADAKNGFFVRSDAGNYRIRHYDTNNCRIIQTNLTVNAMEFDTVYTTDTLTYSCSNDSAALLKRI